MWKNKIIILLPTSERPLRESLSKTTKRNMSHNWKQFIESGMNCKKLKETFLWGPTGSMVILLMPKGWLYCNALPTNFVSVMNALKSSREYCFLNVACILSIDRLWFCPLLQLVYLFLRCANVLESSVK